MNPQEYVYSTLESLDPESFLQVQQLQPTQPFTSKKRELEPNEDSDSSSGENKKSLSRHVSSVVKHFTSSKVGDSRLLSQVDDYLFLLSSGGQLLWVNSSFAHSLSCPQPLDLINSTFSDRIHPDDRVSFVKFMSIALDSHQEQIQYLRMLPFSLANALNSLNQSNQSNGPPSSPVQGPFWEVKAKRHEKSTSSVILICSAREYKSKASLSLDSILDLNLQHILLKTKLNQSRLTNRNDVFEQFLYESSDREKAQVLYSDETSKLSQVFSSSFREFLIYVILRKLDYIVDNVELKTLPNGEKVQMVQRRILLFYNVYINY